MTSEKILAICDPAPPAPVIDDGELEVFCRRNYSPEAKHLGEGSSGGTALETEPEKIVLASDVYPNPFSDYFVFEVQEEYLNQKTTIHLVNALGEVVLGQDFYFETTGFMQIREGLSSLPSGQYYMQLMGENYLSSFKLLKQ